MGFQLKEARADPKENPAPGWVRTAGWRVRVSR